MFSTIFLWISCEQPPTESSDRTVFRMNLPEGLTTLDPAYARDQRSTWMCTQLFDGLVRLDSSLTPQPALAKKWEIAEDGLTYTFHLRTNAWFHKDPVFSTKTRRLTAEDVVYSFSRILDPQTASTGAWVFDGRIEGAGEFRNGTANKVTGFQALDDSTFQLTLAKPFPAILGLLAMPYGFVVPKEAVDAYGKDFAKRPIGSGPFQLYRWDINRHLILHKNPTYYEMDEQGNPLPYLDAVSVSFIPSRLSAFVEFLQGKLDFINGLDPSYKDELLRPDGSIQPAYQGKFQIQRAPQLNTEYLGIMVDSENEQAKGNPFLDVRVRKALNYAIDRKKMVNYILNGMGYPGEAGFVPYGMPGYDPEAVQGYTYRPELAQQLLKEAGFPNGKGLPEIALNSTPAYSAISEYLQKAWQQVGIQVNIQNQDGGSLRSAIYGGKVNFWRASWIADYPEGENYLGLFSTARHSPNGPNTTHFTDPRVDSLLLLSQSLVSDSLRWQAYQQIDNWVMEQAPVVVLFYDRSLRLLQNNIKGLEGNPMNHLHLRKVRKL
ncbi:MAG: peptide ABC transporter substrate-binding protein [Bacteroidota bacterium]